MHGNSINYVLEEKTLIISTLMEQALQLAILLRLKLYIIFFGKNSPLISSTKSLTGHSLGAAGVQESIYSLLMLNEGFLCASANIDHIDEKISKANILRKIKQELLKKLCQTVLVLVAQMPVLIFEALN